MLGCADEYWLGSKPRYRRISANFKKLAKKATVVGHPSLDAWISKGNSKLYDQSAEQKRVLFVGGYGPGYREAFREFLLAMKQLPEFRTRISIHPKVRGELEHKLLKETKVTNVQILAAAHSTISEALQSEVIVSHQSSVGIQALFLGIPTIFLSGRLGIAPRTSSIDGAVAKVIRDGETLIRNLARSRVQDILGQSAQHNWHTRTTPKGSCKNYVPGLSKSNLFNPTLNTSKERLEKFGDLVYPLPNT